MFEKREKKLSKPYAVGELKKITRQSDESSKKIISYRFER
jgi:hypothetical protein